MIRRAAILGCEGIELNFKSLPSELSLDEIKNSLRQNRIEVAAIGTRHMHVTHGLYLASPQKEVRRKAFTYMTECMKIARQLDCQLIQAGWAFQGSRLEAPFDAAWRQAVRSLKEVGKLAKEHDARLAIEIACKQDAQLVNTMDDALRMLAEVNDDNVVVMADTFHIYSEKNSFRGAVLKAGNKLGYVHVSDSGRLPPGTGQINFREFVNALMEIGYKGYMVMEFSPYATPDEALRQAIPYLRKLLA